MNTYQTPVHVLANIVLFYGPRDERSFDHLCRVSRPMLAICANAVNNASLQIEDDGFEWRDMFGRWHSVDDKLARAFHALIPISPGGSYNFKAGRVFMWYWHGQRHRDTKSSIGETLPAVICDTGDKLLLDNNGHCDPDQMSSVVYQCRKMWYHFGEKQRDEQFINW